MSFVESLTSGPVEYRWRFNLQVTFNPFTVVVRVMRLTTKCNVFTVDTFIYASLGLADLPKSAIENRKSTIAMVRVIAGEFRSRRLKTLSGVATRPTSDRLKETLFNLIQTRISGSRFLDCFAGSGSIGIEALSREAAFVAFVESSPTAEKVIHENLKSLNPQPSSRYQVFSEAVGSALRILMREERKFDIVFLDPPYAEVDQYAQTLRLLQSYQLLDPEAVVVAEHSKFLTLPEKDMQLTRSRQIRQGDSVLSLFHLEG